MQDLCHMKKYIYLIIIITILLHFYQQCLKFDEKKIRGGEEGGVSTIMFQICTLKNVFIKMPLKPPSHKPIYANGDTWHLFSIVMQVI